MSDEVKIEQPDVPEAEKAEPQPEPEKAAESKDTAAKESKKDKKSAKEEARLNAELQDVRMQLGDARRALEAERDKFLRLAADFDNYKKRTAAEKESLRGVVVSDTLQMMLPVIDNIERALAAAGEESTPLRDGVDMVYNQAMDAFEKFGVTRFGARGDVFDPNIHNAVMTCEDDELESGVIADVLQPGYKIGDRIIRHALVKVVE